MTHVYHNVQYFIWSKAGVLNFVLLQLDILCVSAVKRYYAKMTIQCSSITYLLSHIIYLFSSWKQKHLSPSSSDLNLVNFWLWGALQQGIVKASNVAIHWSSQGHFVVFITTSARPEKPGRNKHGVRMTVKNKQKDKIAQWSRGSRNLSKVN